jgi:thymidylate synthase
MSDNQNHLRGDGKLPVISVEAETLSEAVHKTIIACYERGARIETPKHKDGMTLGYDGDIIARINNPLQEPRIHKCGLVEDGRGVMQYILEVTHGIHNHWKKTPEHPEWWGYTYNERFVKQLPFVFARIKHDWDEKGRITGRDYQFTTWRAEEDILLEQPDPPCLQRGHLRFLQDNKGEWVLSYVTDWRSRDLAKAWNENIIAQIELQKLMASKVSDMLSIPVKVGCYIDRSSSLHLYGYYFDRDGFENTVKRMQNTSHEEMGLSLDDYFSVPDGYTKEQLKRIIACQSDAEAKGHGLNLSAATLKELNYDINTFPYPSDWDTWPKEWDIEPDPKLLKRA